MCGRSMNRLSDEKKKKRKCRFTIHDCSVYVVKLVPREITFTPLILFGLLNEGCACNDEVLFL